MYFCLKMKKNLLSANQQINFKYISAFDNSAFFVVLPEILEGGHLSCLEVKRTLDNH